MDKTAKYEQVVLIIEDYIFDFIEPRSNWDKAWFQKASYQRWAGNEILNRVRRNPQSDPVGILVEFEKLTREFLRKNNSNRQIFCIANEMVKDILEIVRCLG